MASNKPESHLILYENKQQNERHDQRDFKLIQMVSESAIYKEYITFRLEYMASSNFKGIARLRDAHGKTVTQLPIQKNE